MLRSGPFLCFSERLLPQGQSIGGPVELDFLHFFAQPKLVKIVVQEQEPVAPLARSGPRLANPVQQFAGDSLNLCMAIRFLLAEDMPDGNAQFPRNGHNR